ncbi:MAG TPA: GNAT family N-acetyltransferase [Burkholderiaceae bacterium]|nr:GNAT family N-acetyltransferase [Burkholderiaceae bacterium]
MTRPVLLEVPDQLETERLSIRCPRAGDGAIVHASVVESLAALRAFPASMPWAMQEPSVDASEQFCREGAALYRLRTSLPMLLFLKGSQVHVGSSGLHRLDWVLPKCEIGYWGHSRFAGQGFITEAVKAITEFAFQHLGMRRVEALPDDAKAPSKNNFYNLGRKVRGCLLT